jgi:hypothetical protein
VHAVFALDQIGVDRAGEARIIQLHAEEDLAAVLSGLFFPSGAELDGTGEDAIVGSLVAFLLDRDELRFDIEAERLDRAPSRVRDADDADRAGARVVAGEAVLGQSSTVLLKRSISVCFAICWRTLPRCPLARSRRPDWSAAPLVGRFSATR